MCTSHLFSRHIRRLALFIPLTIGLFLAFSWIISVNNILRASASPGIIYVSVNNGADTGTCGTQSAPCQTISYTVNKRSTDGDTIRVAQGRYTENLVVDHVLILEGGYNPSNWTRDPDLYATAIDGSNNQFVQGDWDGNAVMKPAVISDSLGYKMWFDGVNLQEDTQIGLAGSSDGLTWEKYTNNPVITGTNGAWDGSGEHAPAVLRDGAVYKMWYEGVNPDGIHQLGYATSLDGISWEKYSSNPVLTPGPLAFDRDAVGHGSVLKEGSTYKLWYHAIGDQDAIIAYATSPDGIAWTKLGPVLLPGDGTWDEYGLWGPSVLHINGVYWMWYSGSGPQNNAAIGVVTSTNGVDWNLLSSTPVISDVHPIGDPTVISETSKLKMWYTDFATGQIRYKESADGINWVNPGSDPALDHGETGKYGAPVIKFVSGSAGSILDGFTIRNGYTESGGGIQLDGTDVTIRNNYITRNKATANGGGIYLTNYSKADFINNMIASNSTIADVGGGGGGLLAEMTSTVTLTNNTFLDNFANCCGGAVGIWWNSSGRIVNNHFEGNTAQNWMGGALFLNGYTFDVISNTIQNNRTLVEGGGGIGVNGDMTKVRITGNSFISNTAQLAGAGAAINWGPQGVVKDNLFRGNISKEWLGSGLEIVTARALVDGNIFMNNSNEGQNGAGVVGIAMDGPSQPVTLTNNIIAGNHDKGINISDGVEDLYIINNTVVSNTFEGIQAWGPITVPLVRNNIVANNLNCGIAAGPGSVFTVVDHNNVWNNGGGGGNYCDYGSGIAPAPGAGALSINPKFVNASTGDYHLSSTSPAIDAGSNTASPTTDYEGDVRPLDGNMDGIAGVDIGADEYLAKKLYLPLTLFNR